ncbi:MAG: hypothetical protein NTU98_08465 [Bacteroidetes bacterium]|nr:hypothetical protein [Bacteroidota bacterium]
MFGSIALDVFIGMVLIYLLYSLLISIIGEMLATWMGIRARLLRKAIEKMLNDNPEASKIPSGKRKKILYFLCLQRRNFLHFILFEFKSFENSLAGKFYQHPSIKYLAGSSKNSASFKNGKPAYISRENFADTMIQIFRNNGSGANDKEKITGCLNFNTLGIQTQTKAHILNLMADSGNDLEKFREKLMKWFDDTMDRTTGWYKRKLSLITFWLGFIIAVAFNVDSIQIAKQLSQDKDARNQLVQMGISQVKEGSVTDSNVKRMSDSIKADTLLQKSFNEVYKATESANKILGLGWKFDTFRKKADVSWTFSPFTFKYIKKEILVPLGRLDTLRKQYSAFANNPSFAAKKKIYLDKVRVTNAYIDFHLHRLNRFIQAEFTAYDTFQHLKDTSGNSARVTFYGKEHYGTWNKIGYIICKCNPLGLSFWGFVITALMLSLGAPFWFDLLKKLVALRGAGVKPEEKEDNGKNKDNGNKSSSTEVMDALLQAQKLSTTQTVKEDPVVTALRNYGDLISKEQGVIKVLQGYLKTKNNPVKCVQVNMEDNDSAIKIKEKYKKLRVAENEFVPVNVLVTGKPELLSASPATGIAEKGIGNNIDFPKGMGTFSCLVRERFHTEIKYLITSYHVVNRDKDWSGKPSKSTVVNNLGIPIASTYKGYLNSHQDTALITITEDTIKLYKSIPNVRYPKGIREVTGGDVYSTQVFINGYATAEGSGMITHESIPETFPYGNELKYFEDLIQISHIKPDGNLSPMTQVGDSGSLVLDKDDNAIGIVLARDLLHTYALKITTILDELGLELIP